MRGVMVNPILFLAFETMEDAEEAAKQHICLARNEDILYPQDGIIKVSEEEFDLNEELFYGFELIAEKCEQSFLVGYNRMDGNKPMYGWLKIVGILDDCVPTLGALMLLCPIVPCAPVGVLAPPCA